MISIRDYLMSGDEIQKNLIPTDELKQHKEEIQQRVTDEMNAIIQNAENLCIQMCKFVNQKAIILSSLKQEGTILEEDLYKYMCGFTCKRSIEIMHRLILHMMYENQRHIENNIKQSESI